jgi:CRISPR-associated endonuclease/helicase Cas3
MRWQCRLYGQWLADDIKPVIDLPTGMGKTSVMAIWLLARARQVEENREECLPRRLVYVVDRRTVVDQATTLAEKLAAGAGIHALEVPAISTLRCVSETIWVL